MMEHWNIGFFKNKFLFIIPLFHYSIIPVLSIKGVLEHGVIGTNICPKI
jgi:hypothetical protein